MVRAIATMFANVGDTRRQKPAAELPVSPKAIFDAVAANGAILCDPVDNRWFGRLGGLLKSVRVEQGDLDTLLAWFDAGGVATWPQGKPTFTHFLQHLDKWLAFSREWDRRGRQQLGYGKQGAIGTAEAPADWSAFK